MKHIGKVETFLEQREVAFLSSIKIFENLIFSTAHPEKFKFSQILMDDKKATYLCSRIITTLAKYLADAIFWLNPSLNTVILLIWANSFISSIFGLIFAVMKFTVIKFGYGELLKSKDITFQYKKWL